MSRIGYIDGLLRNLEGRIPRCSRAFLEKEEAHRQLTLITGKDFKYDSQSWSEWIDVNGYDLKGLEKR